MATKKKPAAKPKKTAAPKSAPKPVLVQRKVEVVFVKDAPRYGKKGEVRMMTEEAMKYVNSKVRGAVKKK